MADLRELARRNPDLEQAMSWAHAWDQALADHLVTRGGPPLYEMTFTPLGEQVRIFAKAYPNGVPALWVPLAESTEARMLRFGHDGTVTDLGAVTIGPIELEDKRPPEPDDTKLWRLYAKAFGFADLQPPGILTQPDPQAFAPGDPVRMAYFPEAGGLIVATPAEIADVVLRDEQPPREPWTFLPTTDEDPGSLAFVPYSTVPDLGPGELREDDTAKAFADLRLGGLMTLPDPNEVA